MDTKMVKNRNIESANGCSNWLAVMLLISTTVMVTDNYKRFGIVIGPFETVAIVARAIINHWWLYGMMCVWGAQQIFQTFVIEKLLALRIFSERFGMTLHAFNTFFFAVAFTVTVRMYETNSGVIRCTTPWVLFTIVKVWSYAYVNSTLRKQTAKNEDGHTHIVQYPSNITLYNIITYMVFTPVIPYKVHYPERAFPNWSNFIKQIFFAFCLYSTMVFVTSQFIIPELYLLKTENYEYVEVVSCFLRIMLFVHLVWILGYLLTYRVYLPAYAYLTGIENLVIDGDWWNSPHFTEFWRRWNYPVYIGLKDTIVKPLLRHGWSKNKSVAIAFMIAGILHEFINTFPLGVFTGVGFFVTLTEIPIGRLSRYSSCVFGKEIDVRSTMTNNIIYIRNDLIGTYMIYASILTITFSLHAPAIGITRAIYKAFMHPEDSRYFGVEVRQDENVERIRRTYKNAMENIPIFLTTGFMYIITNPPLGTALFFFRTYLITRTLYSLTYAFGLFPKAIGFMSFLISFFITIYMCYHVLQSAIYKYWQLNEN